MQLALQKLGPEPTNNELLAELIKLGANNATIPSRLNDYSDNINDCKIEAASFSYNFDKIERKLTSDDHQHQHRKSSTTTNNNNDHPKLRSIVVDGSNVAMSHGNKKIFSCRGIKLCVDWFRARGHNEITVFVPKWRKESSRPDNPISDQEVLEELERDRLLVFTPSR